MGKTRTVEDLWCLSHGHDRVALDVVDGRGVWEGHGAHYSRRTRDSRSFTGVGQEIVLVTRAADAVWAVVLQKTPSAPGTGISRGRNGNADRTRWVWRNMLFRNLGPILSSDLIRTATVRTYAEWLERYGKLPDIPLRTEIDTRKIRSTNPGFCYLRAGWMKLPTKRRGMLYLRAPAPEEVL